MRLFIGLDVSLAMTAICVINEHGEIVKEAEAASDPEILAHWLGDLAHGIAAIGLEAEPVPQWLHRGLAELGLDGLVSEKCRV